MPNFKTVDEFLAEPEDASVSVNQPAPLKSVDEFLAEPEDAIENTPTDLAFAQKELGKKELQGYCQEFVRLATKGNITGDSAIHAWMGNRHRAVQGTDGIQKGDAVYFSPNESNEFFGHAGIYSGDGKFISATDDGVKNYSLKDWQEMTGQKILGYIPQRK